MAGFGFMIHAIKSLDYNKSLRSKHQVFDRKNLNSKTILNDELEFPKENPEYIKKLQLEFKKERKKRIIVEVIIILLSLSITSWIGYLLFK